MTDVLDGVRNHYRATGLLERAGFRTLVWQDDTEAAKAWFAQMHASGPPPSPNLETVMGPDFAQLAGNLARNLNEGRLGILSAVFEAACIQAVRRPST